MSNNSIEKREETPSIEKIEVNQLSETVSLQEITKMDMNKLANIILQSGLAPKALNTESKIIVAMQMGKELGFKELSSLNYIHVIEGKPTLSVHAMSALIKKLGIEYQLVEDAVKIYADGSTSIDDRYEFDEAGAFKLTADGNKIKVKAVDVRTSIKFMRMWNGMLLEDTISFTYKEAKDQELIAKSNWKRMFKIMMRARCLAIGARFVAPQVFMGTYEISEILDAKNIDYRTDEEGNVIEVEGKIVD